MGIPSYCELRRFLSYIFPEEIHFFTIYMEIQFYDHFWNLAIFFQKQNITDKIQKDSINQ